MSSSLEPLGDFLAFFGITMAIILVVFWLIATMTCFIVTSDMKDHVEKFHASPACEMPKIPVEKQGAVNKNP